MRRTLPVVSEVMIFPPDGEVEGEGEGRARREAFKERVQLNTLGFCPETNFKRLPCGEML